MNKASNNLLIDDHSELGKLLEEIFVALQKGDHPRAFTRLDYFWARLAIHIRAEHLRLFPAIRGIAGESPESREIPELLGELRHDHDFFMRELARAIKAMRLVFDFGNEAETFVVVRELLEGVKERLKLHNRIEEEKVYTLATQKFLEPAAMETLLCAIQKELDNLPPRFIDDSGSER